MGVFHGGARDRAGLAVYFEGRTSLGIVEIAQQFGHRILAPPLSIARRIDGTVGDFDAHEIRQGVGVANRALARVGDETLYRLAVEPLHGCFWQGRNNQGMLFARLHSRRHFRVRQRFNRVRCRSCSGDPASAGQFRVINLERNRALDSLSILRQTGYRLIVAGRQRLCLNRREIRDRPVPAALAKWQRNAPYRFAIVQNPHFQPRLLRGAGVRVNNKKHGDVLRIARNLAGEAGHHPAIFVTHRLQQIGLCAHGIGSSHQGYIAKGRSRRSGGDFEVHPLAGRFPAVAVHDRNFHRIGAGCGDEVPLQSYNLGSRCLDAVKSSVPR